MGFQLPCIPALFRVSDTFFLLPPTCFLILRQQVWVSSPPQPQLLQASAVPYPDSLDGDSLCPSLACSLNAAYTSVSIPFIQISLLSHLRDRTLTDGMSYQVFQDLASAFLAHNSMSIPAVTSPTYGPVLLPLPELFFLTLFTWLSPSFPSFMLPCIWSGSYTTTQWIFDIK